MRRFARQFRVREESKDAKPVFDNDQHGAVGNQGTAVVQGVEAAGAGDVGSQQGHD